MHRNFSIPELDKIAIFFALLTIAYVFRPRQRSVTRNYSNQQQSIARPPTGTGIFLAKGIIFTIIIVASSVLLQYSENVVEYEADMCDEQRYRSKHGCVFEEYTSSDLSKQMDGFLMNQEVSTGFDIGEQLNHASSPSGPWYWIYYVFGGLIIVSGFRLAKVRQQRHLRSLRSVEEELRPIIRQLANDPRGVIEGRIGMPLPVEASKPSGKENRRVMVIFFFCALISIVTMLSFFDSFYRMGYGFAMHEGNNQDAVLLAMMALGFNISGHFSVKYLMANYPGEAEGLNNVRAPQNIENNSNQPNQTKVTSAKEVLEELAKEMRATRIESEMLRVQLNETRMQVSNLETELERKTSELETIQALTTDMERIVKQSESSSQKNLSLMDSVLVGDPLFNGDKIDKQVVNDPKAIAKAAIEAYKAGRTDVKSAELDF
ncbi:MAG: hypothetical protein VX023_00320 [Candidatus Thermoplasmatota archaeon]|nr:hypothetical protein [Candidatus Thermoplasmatota archaeon]